MFSQSFKHKDIPYVKTLLFDAMTDVHTLFQEDPKVQALLRDLLWEKKETNPLLSIDELEEELKEDSSPLLMPSLSMTKSAGHHF